MRCIVSIILILLMLPIVSAGFLIDNEFDTEDSIVVDNVDYSIKYLKNSDKLQISSLFDKFFIDSEDCKINEYHTYCFVNISREVEEEDVVVELTVEKTGCVNNSVSCREDSGSYCISDSDCLGKCVHGICTQLYPVCGDGYCDKNERCNVDCVRAVLVENDSFVVNISLDWADVFVLEEGRYYNFSLDGEYVIGYNEDPIDYLGKDAHSSENPCPGINTGALVADLCGKCHKVSSLQSFEGNGCMMKVKLNENVFLDNFGEISVSFEVGDKVVEETVEEEPVQEIKQEITAAAVTELESRNSNTPAVVGILVLLLVVSVLGLVVKLFKKPY